MDGACDARLVAGDAGVGPPVRSVDPLLTEYDDWQSIFGQAPLPDPYRFFLEFHRLVRDVAGLPREPVEYLNFRGSMIQWLEVVYSRSYLLLSAPTSVVAGAQALLDAQSVPHIALPEPAGKTSGANPKFVFRCGRSWIVACECSVRFAGET